MSRVVLYPYLRLNPSDVAWSAWSAVLDGRPVELTAISNGWDPDATLAFRIAVSTPPEALSTVEADPQRTRLVVTVSCRDTALTATKETEFVGDTSGLSASAQVSVSGRDVSEVIELRAHIIAPLSDSAWLNRRILADGPSLRVTLDSTLSGFPTTSRSFDDEELPPAPWRLVVTADDAEAPFMHSVRLELNIDYLSIRDLIDGNAAPAVRAELSASITRVLIGTVSHLVDGATDPRTPDEIAAEAPDSIAAAAARAARQARGLSLNGAVSLYRRQPERFEHYVASGTRLLKD